MTEDLLIVAVDAADGKAYLPAKEFGPLVERLHALEVENAQLREQLANLATPP